MTTERIRWCRHHQKPKPLVDKCALGVNIPEIGTRGTGGFYTLPCHDATHPTDKRPKHECPHRSFFTDAEIAAQDEESAAHAMEFLRRFELVAPIVARLKREQVGKNGREPCPVCGGMLDWNCSARNKHVAMRCSTADCIVFME